MITDTTMIATRYEEKSVELSEEKDSTVTIY